MTPGKGVPIALFFYPKAGTTGCTKEACQFRDALSDTKNDIFKRNSIEVVGVSAGQSQPMSRRSPVRCEASSIFFYPRYVLDPVSKQKKFVDENGLNYPVLSDEKGEARKAYAVGKGLMGLTDGQKSSLL